MYLLLETCEDNNRLSFQETRLYQTYHVYFFNPLKNLLDSSGSKHFGTWLSHIEVFSTYDWHVFSKGARRIFGIVDRISAFHIRAPLADSADIQMSAPGGHTVWRSLRCCKESLHVCVCTRKELRKLLYIKLWCHEIITTVLLLVHIVSFSRG